MIEKGAADGRYKVDVPLPGKLVFSRYLLYMQQGCELIC
jgi:hypothetical protein